MSAAKHTPGPIPTVEELEQLARGHVGHPADFGADVLERWGGWPKGLLGQGGTLERLLAEHTPERIVQCVNAHDELVALLTRARKVLAWAIDGGQPDRRNAAYIERPARMLKHDYDEALAVCAAIAKATGSTS